MSLKALHAFLIIGFLSALAAQAKPANCDKRWSLGIPDEWWYSDTQNRGILRTYSFGAGSPDPLKDAPVMLVDGKMNGTTPELIRGISLGIAQGNVAIVAMEGAERITRKDSWLGEGYRKEIKTFDGPLILRVFIFEARRLPGPPLPGPETRLAMVHIAGKTEDEVEQFTKLFEKIQAAKQQ